MQFLTLLFKELREHASSNSFIAYMVVLFVLITSALLITAYDYNEQHADARAQQQIEERLLGMQQSWNGFGARGVNIVSAPPPLYLFDRGTMDVVGRHITVSSLSDVEARRSALSENPIIGLFGSLDITGIVRFVISFFIIVLIHDAICGERERGTLRQVMSSSIKRSTVLLAKMLGGFIVISIAFLAALSFGTAIISIAWPGLFNTFTAEHLVRLGLLVFLYLCFIAFLVAASTAVSATMRRSATSFILLLLLWVVMVIIIPRGATAAAHQLNPVPSYSDTLREALAGTPSYGQYTREKMAELQRTTTNQMELAMKAGELMQQTREEFIAMKRERWRDAFDAFSRDSQAQFSMVRTISRLLSPVSAMTFAARELTETGWMSHHRKLENLRRFQDSFEEYVGEQVEVELSSGPMGMVQRMISGEDIEYDPQRVRFSNNPRDLTTAINAALPDLALLIILATVCTIVGVVMINRYDVR